MKIISIKYNWLRGTVTMDRMKKGGYLYIIEQEFFINEGGETSFCKYLNWKEWFIKVYDFSMNCGRKSCCSRSWYPNFISNNLKTFKIVDWIIQSGTLIHQYRHSIVLLLNTELRSSDIYLNQMWFRALNNFPLI